MKKKTLNLPTPQPKRLTLQFTPTAWAKLLFLRDLGSTEIGGFGLAAAGNLLRVEDVVLVEQVCTAIHVEFNDRSVADFFDQQVDAGRRPEEFARIWVHTHPGSSAAPSRTDEQTFERAFGTTDWAVMFILARGGQSYARLRYNVGPGADVQLPVEVDYCQPFSASDEANWERDYDRCVQLALPPVPRVADLQSLPPVEDDLTVDWYDAWEHYIEPYSPIESTHVHDDDF
jgi:proteasome lid subunit RPN8/RPN11